MLIGDDADRMPNKPRTVNSGERVLAMVLPSAFRWKDQLPKINICTTGEVGKSIGEPLG